MTGGAERPCNALGGGELGPVPLPVIQGQAVALAAVRARDGRPPDLRAPEPPENTARDAAEEVRNALRAVGGFTLGLRAGEPTGVRAGETVQDIFSPQC